MTLRPLTAQLPAFVAWEDEVTDELGQALDVCRSDAQGIVEAQAETMDSAWLRQLDAKTAAALIIEAATPNIPEGATA